MSPITSRAIAERAHEQLGHITRHQLTELGLSAKAIRRLVAHGYEPWASTPSVCPACPVRSSGT